ncbi:hypothetical protein C9374_012352 [Naegleria lovaniensis]|uniref:Uncharacterized protein n=1 Tax=Naegleria lovaniensis TaxID=51637 RepID=A0AA88KDU5_NAELO|nr:uncharacterized protein C9374_012352 [Naegleria lovaniensis]KAG2373249.1 hypothetical protein C9374_012352 [Naegleria lovaniensis]
MHAEIQGLGRRHLRYILDEFNYTGIISDLQDLVSTTVNAAGQPLKFKVKDFENCSADDFLEFLAFSVHPIYQVLVKNSKLQGRSMVLRKKHVLCWSCHVSFVSHLLQDNLTTVGIEKARSSYIKFCKFFLELFKSKSCKFPNFHWIAHIFEDCLEWGSPRFFWALLFELKHKEFKQFNDSSNHKNVESRACEFEKLRRQIFINYLWYRTKCISEKWFPPLQSGQYIIFKDETNFKIGQVDSISPLGVSLRAVFKINNVQEATGLRTLAVEHISESVSLDSIYGRASIVKFDEHLVFNQHCLMMDFYKF